MVFRARDSVQPAILPRPAIPLKREDPAGILEILHYISFPASRGFRSPLLPLNEVETMRTPIATPFTLSACLIASLLAPHPVAGQSGFFIRLASEVSALSVEHTKTVTIGGGSSASTSSSSGFGTAILVTGGVRSSASAGWMFGSELEVVFPSPRLLKGTIDPTNSGNPHDVWPGRWEFSDKLGVGGTFLAGRSVDGGDGRIYLLLGVRRSWGDFATGGTNPETGVAGEDRERLGHWPLSAGIGMTMARRWPVDVRLRYFRSAVDWVISQPDLGLDYDYVVSGFALSVGVRRESDR